jgi:hypothetical protein
MRAAESIWRCRCVTELVFDNLNTLSGGGIAIRVIENWQCCDNYCVYKNWWQAAQGTENSGPEPTYGVFPCHRYT